VRGDSLRDLYAKTLALLGLALLAGVGALVDYWPAPVGLPAVASPAVKPVLGALPAVASLDAVVLTVTSLTPRGRAATLGAFTQREPAAAVARVSLGTLPVGDHMALAAGVSISDPPPVSDPPPAAAVPPVVAATQLPALEVALPPAPMTTLGPGSSTGAREGTSDGFFDNATSAFKKTGESIVNTTVKTGTSIMKAFGVVGGAFKKVI
jgi:hypothetical protein